MKRLARTNRPDGYNGFMRKMRREFGFGHRFTFDDAVTRFGSDAAGGVRTKFGEFMAYAVQVGAMTLLGEQYLLVNPNKVLGPSAEQQRRRADEAVREKARLAQTITVEEAEAMVRRAVAEATAKARRREEDLCQKFDQSTAAASEQIHRLQGPGRKYLNQGNLQGAREDAAFRIALVRSLARSARNQWMNFGSWCADLIRDMRWPAGTFMNSAIGRVVHLISQAHPGLIEYRKGADGAEFKLGYEGCAIAELDYVEGDRAYKVEDISSTLGSQRVAIHLLQDEVESLKRRAEAAEARARGLEQSLEVNDGYLEEVEQGYRDALAELEQLKRLRRQ